MLHEPMKSTLFPYTTLFRSVIVEPEIILEGVGADDVVLAVGESEHDPARGVLTSGDGLEFHRHVDVGVGRSEEHTSELQSQFHLVCRLLLEKKKHRHWKRRL